MEPEERGGRAWREWRSLEGVMEPGGSDGAWGEWRSLGRVVEPGGSGVVAWREWRSMEGVAEPRE